MSHQYSPIVQMNRQNRELLETRLGYLNMLQILLIDYRLNDELLQVDINDMREELNELLLEAGGNTTVEPCERPNSNESSVFIIPFMIMKFAIDIGEEFGLMVGYTQLFPYNFMADIPSHISEERMDLMDNTFLMDLRMDVRRNLGSTFDLMYDENGHDDCIPKSTLLPKIKSKVLKKSLLTAPSLNDCGICLENHIKRDTVSCLCSHEFGKTCFEGWKQICIKNNKNVTCPSCRGKVTELKTYREKAKRKKCC